MVSYAYKKRCLNPDYVLCAMDGTERPPLQRFTLANCPTLFLLEKLILRRLELTYKEGEIVKSST